MPHYPVQLDETLPGSYAVFSTVVMDTITPPMSAAAMRDHLAENGYGCWLKNEPRDRQYWHPLHGFQFVKQSDHWYT